MQPDVGAPGGFGARGGESVFCGAEVSAKVGVGGFLSLFFCRGGFLRLGAGVFGKRTQTAQTRATPAATSRSRLTAGCCRSRFVVALVCVDWRIDVYEPPDLRLPLPAKIDKQSKRIS